MYQVASGGEMGTFYALRPVASLEEIDPANMAAEKAYDAALGTEGRQKLRQYMVNGDIRMESAIFAFDPKMSFAPPAFAAADSFWAPQGMQAAVGTSGKSTAKMTKKPKK